MGNKTSRRSCLSISLRSLLIGVTLISLWLGLYVNRIVVRKRAVSVVIGLEGTVRYDYQPTLAEQARVSRQNLYRSYRSLPPLPSPVAEPQGPAWLRRWIGDDYFIDVAEVQLSQTDVSDADLRQLAPLQKLEILALANTSITDAGIRQLPRLPHLRVLRLQATHVTDESLAALADCTSLDTLDVRGTAVTFEGVTQLERALPGVTVLSSRR